MMTHEVFEKTYPPPPSLFDITLQKPDELVKSNDPKSEKRDDRDEETYRLSSFVLKTAVSEKQHQLNELNGYFYTIKTSASNEPERMRNQVRIVFDSGLQIGEGRKQTAKHWSNLITWHQTTTKLQYDSVGKCAEAVNHYFGNTSRSLGGFRSKLLDITEFTKSGARVIDTFFAYLRDEESGRDFVSASSACSQPMGVEISQIPGRPSFADTLGPVGGATRWLLDTEQMPLVIIVGLVGFSLLGATVSRAVCLGLNRPNPAMSLDDLLIVIAGGTTAAVVVFLAAYGGLALLGNTGGDPNPYVVFVTCLIGAVYSEDVWAWSRTTILKSTTQAREEKAKPEETRESEPTERSESGVEGREQQRR